MTTIATSKVEAIYAAALRQKGYKVVVLLPTRDSILQRLFAATGETEFIYFSDFEVEEESNIEQQVEEILAEYSEYDDFSEFELEGFRIGRNALSAAVRRLRVGSIDSASISHRKELEDSLKLSLFAKVKARLILEAVKPTLTLFVERGYSPTGELFDACLLQGIDVIQWLGAPQSNRFIFKRYNINNRDQHPLSLDRSTWEKLKGSDIPREKSNLILEKLASHYKEGAWFNRQQLQLGKKIFDSSETLKRLGVSPGRKVAMIFSHILYDATFFFGSNLFNTYESWLIETVRCAINNPKLDWIIKVHPVNIWRSQMDGMPLENLEAIAIKKEFGDLPKHVRLLSADTDINTFSMFDCIDVGITVRGTIGMELPCWGIPVVTAGTGRYSGNGFTIDPVSKVEYQSLMSRLHEIPRLTDESVRLARLYAHGTFFGRSFPLDSFSIDFNAETFGLRALTQNTQISRVVRKTGVFGKDIVQMVDWLTHSRDADLIDLDY